MEGNGVRVRLSHPSTLHGRAPTSGRSGQDLRDVGPRDVTVVRTVLSRLGRCGSSPEGSRVEGRGGRAGSTQSL